MMLILKRTFITIVIFYLSSFNNDFFIKANSKLINASLKPQQKEQINNSAKAWADYEQAETLHNEGEFLSAEKEFLKVIRIAKKLNDKDLLANSYNYLGQVENWKSNFSKSIYFHKKARELYQELKNEEYAYNLNNYLAIEFSKLGEYDSAKVYFEKNIKDREKIQNINIVVTTYQNFAALYAELLDYKQSFSLLQHGIEYAEEKGCQFSLANLYFTTGSLFHKNNIQIKITLQYLLAAKTIFTERNNRIYINLVDLNIGSVYYKAGNDSLAFQYLKKVYENVRETNYPIISQVNHILGMLHKRKKQYHKALFYFDRSIEFMCRKCPEIQIHNTLLEAANTYLIKGKSKQAYSYLNRAKKIATESKSGLETVSSFEALAEYFQSTNNLDSTKHYLTRALNLANEYSLYEKVKNTAESLSEIYYSNGEFQKSSDYLTIANKVNDNLANIDKYSKIAKLEMRFEIEKIEKERKLEETILQSEIAKQTLIRDFSISGLILFIVIGLLLLKAYRNKKKDNELLAKQKKEIQDISVQLQESGKRKLDFFTNISHEIRTPLTLIISPIERILKLNSKNKETIDQLQLALNNTNKLKDLVNQILDLQKLDEHHLRLDLSEFDLVTSCTSIVNSFEGFCYQRNCELFFESNIKEARINFDQGRLHSIINNLLSNAFKFNKESGLVKFYLEVNSNNIKIEIKDTGRGISSEHLKRLGERYYQVERADFTVEGTGIGFAYVKEIVELMNGELEISSILNEGTNIIITFPCDQIEICDESPSKLNIKPTEKLFDQLPEQISDKNETGLPRILIVEDNLEMRLFLCDLFKNSYQVISAKDGLEGKEMALKYLPDIIISDVMMPELQGNQLCEFLKNNVNTSHIIIILFTAKGAPDSIVDGYDCGADDYIVKPFDSDLLVKKVNNIISTAENARRQFSFTDIERTNSVYSEYDSKFLNDCIAIIKENIDDSNLTVETLAENLNIHRRTLLRKFKALTGKSPIDLIKHTKMSYAKELIRDKKYRVNEVAFMVGYEDSNSFSKAFKQFHGISPSSYN